MRTLRGSVRFALFTALALGAAARADAQLLVAATPGDPPAIAHAELAYAVGAGAPVTWLSLRVQRGPVALVAALPEDAVAEPALDAWFKALEITASPNVLLPRDASACGKSDSFVHVSWPRSSGTAATELSLAAPDDVKAALDEQGLTLDGELPSAARYLIWSWPAADSEQTTRTLRVLGGATPLTFTPGAPFPVLVSSITRGASSYADELGNDQLKVTFLAGDLADTDYKDRLREWLDQRPEPLLEMRARGPLFDWSIYDDQVSLAPLVRSYAVRAAQELSDLDIDACSDQLRALRDPQAPAASACGDARDASLALAAAGSELATLQRFAISAGAGLSPSGAHDGGDPSVPILRAKLLDDSACNTAPWPPMPLYPTPSETDGSAGKTSGNTTVVVVEGSIGGDETSPPEAGCGSSAPQQEGYYEEDDSSSGSVDCSSDSSSSSEADSSDSCSGDSSSSSSSDSSSDSCSGDSSSSSSSGSSSDSCSGDSSSSSSSGSSSDSGCSGGSDESSSYDGDTCTGSAAPGAERTQRAQASLTGRPSPTRPKRLKTSLWTLGFAALLFPIRRRKRRLDAAG